MSATSTAPARAPPPIVKKGGAETTGQRLSSLAILVSAKPERYLKAPAPSESMTITLCRGQHHCQVGLADPSHINRLLTISKRRERSEPLRFDADFRSAKPGSTLCDLAAITSRCRNVDGSSAYRLAAFGLRHRLDCSRLSSASV